MATARNVWRDGPSGARYEPEKPEIRTWGTGLENTLSGISVSSQSVVVRATRAELLALPAGDYAAGVIGQVTQDDNQSYRGVYKKGSGSSWSKIADLPADIAQDAAESAESFRDEGEEFRNDAEDFKDDAEAARDIAAGYASDAVSQGNVPIYATAAGIAALTIPSGIGAFRVNGYAAAGDRGEALYNKVGSEPAHDGKLHSADGAWWEIVISAEVRPEQFGAKGDGSTNDTAAVQKAFDVLSSLSRKGTVLFSAVYSIDKLTMRSGVGWKCLTRNAGLKWREQSPANPYTASSNATLTKGSKTVTVSGNITANVAVGRIARKSGSSDLYVVADISYSSPNTTITLNRGYLGANASGATLVFNDPYGMIEWPQGVTTWDDIETISIDADATNRGGFVMYCAASKGGASSGGNWNAVRRGIRIANCHNGIWLRGTTTTPYSNSLEPIQFTDWHNLIVERASGSDGANIWVTGQANQQTFYAPLLQKLNGDADFKGVVIYVDQEPLGTLSGTSNKSPQGLRFLHPSIQGAEYGWLSNAGETAELYRPYFENIPKVITAYGYNVSNQLELLLVMPEFKGNMGTTVPGYGSGDADPGYLMKAGANARISMLSGHFKTNSLNVWVNDGGELVVVSPPLLIQGLDGFEDGRTSPLVPTKTLTSGVLELASERAASISVSGPFTGIKSDRWAGDSIKIIVGNVNGLIITNAGNLILPNGRSRWRLLQNDVIEAVRSDVSGAVGWILRRLPTIKPIITRGVSFTLPEEYLYRMIQINGTSTVTLPTDANATGIAIGDEFEFIFTSGTSLTFAAESGATVNAPGGTLVTSTAYSRARAIKFAANSWMVNFA